MALEAGLTALLVATLGDDYSGQDPDRIAEILLADKIGQGGYTEETFTAHLEAIADKGDGYVDFIEGLSNQPGMKAMFVFIIQSGPGGVYGLIQQMGSHGLLDKKKVASAAKLPTKAKKERDGFRQVWDELGTSAWTHVNDLFTERRDEFVQRFPELAECDNLTQLMWFCGKSTLMTGVTKMHVAETKTDASLALGFRIDAHSPARNGGWDAGKGTFTDKYLEKKAEAEAKAAAATNGVTEDSESTDDEPTGDQDESPQPIA